MKYAPDETIEVQSPKVRFRAKVLIATSMKLKQVPLAFLEYDLEAKPGEKRQDLMNKLGKLYKFSERPNEDDVAHDIHPSEDLKPLPHPTSLGLMTKGVHSELEPLSGAPIRTGFNRCPVAGLP